MAQLHAIGSLDEARSYLQHPVLGTRTSAKGAAFSIGTFDMAGVSFEVEAAPALFFIGFLNGAPIAPVTIIPIDQTFKTLDGSK